MIKKTLYITLCLLWLADVKAAPYELSNQGLSLHGASQLDDEKYFEVKDYTNKPSAHQRRGHQYPRPRIITHCHPVTVLGPPIWTFWGWRRYPVVITDCHSVIACDDPIYDEPYHGPVDSPAFEETHCDYRRGRNRLLNAVCDRDTSKIRSLLRENIYLVNQRSDVTGETALILAAKLGHNRIVRSLVEEFAADGCVTHRSLTAADWAYEFGHDRIERFLERAFSCYD